MPTTYIIPKALSLTPKVQCASGVVAKNPEVKALLGPAPQCTALLALVQDSSRMPTIPRGNCALAFDAFVQVAKGLLADESNTLLMDEDAGGVPAVELLAARLMRLRSWHLRVCSSASSHRRASSTAVAPCHFRLLGILPSIATMIADCHWELHQVDRLIRETQAGRIQQLYLGKAGTNLRRELVAKRHSHLFWREWVPKEGRSYIVLCRTSTAVLACFDGERSLAELELAFLRKAAPLFGTAFANQKMQSSLNWRREGGGVIYLMIRRHVGGLNNGHGRAPM
jgi:hypothetical protein